VFCLWLFFAQPEDFAPVGATVDDYDITVCVRKRPLNEKEQESSSLDIITRSKTHEAVVHEPVKRVDGTQDIKNTKFVFDQVFHEEEDSRRVYDCIFSEKLQYVWTGNCAICFGHYET